MLSHAMAGLGSEDVFELLAHRPRPPAAGPLPVAGGETMKADSLTMADLKKRVRASYGRALAPRGRPPEAWQPLPGAVALIANINDTQIALWADELVRMGYAQVADEDADAAMAKLRRWQRALRILRNAKGKA
jgi:hypothetical protein